MNDLSTAEIILQDMEHRSGNSSVELAANSISKLYPHDLKEWMAVSNLNHTQIMELNRILLIKEMVLPDSCEFLNKFVENYIRMNVSKNAHGRHDIRDIFSGLGLGSHEDDNNSSSSGLRGKISNIIGK